MLASRLLAGEQLLPRVARSPMSSVSWLKASFQHLQRLALSSATRSPGLAGSLIIAPRRVAIQGACGVIDAHRHVAFGSIRVARMCHMLRGMSAVLPIAPELMHRGETTRWANLGHR